MEEKEPGILRVGIIGAGLIAPMHAAGFQEIPAQAQVVAVCDLDPEAAANLAGLFDATIYSDYQALLDDERIDLVDILLPHHLHYPVAMDAIQKGKHVLLEKPVALAYAHALEIVEAARQAGVQLGIAENTRFIHAYQAAEQVIRSGQLGEITLVRTFLPANERMRLSSPDFWGKQADYGGGALIDSGPHSFYLLKWLFGPVAELSAYTSQIYQVGSQVEDNADVVGRLANGANFLCSFTFTAEIPHSERLEVYGSRGSLIVDQLANPPVRLYAEPTDFDGRPLEGVDYDPIGWQFFSIVEEVKDFVRSVSAGLPPTVDPLDCCYAIHVIEKAYLSARLGGQRLHVPVPPSHP